MTAAGETTEQPSETTSEGGLGRAVPIEPVPVQPVPVPPAPAQPTPELPGTARPEQAVGEPPAARPLTGQQRAHRVLADLLDAGATQHLPAIDWTLAAFEPRLIGRCTAYPGPGRRRGDFEAWRALLGAEATEERTGDQPVRLTARTERDGGRVVVEIAADLYDDLPDTSSPAPAPGSVGWRSP
ncbi:MAG TPA: hypothetical protein VGH27_20150 [Streptosporangiaceae bacterium]